MSDVRTFRAATMHEALMMVRRELGPQAAILHTREVQTRRLFGWLAGPRQIEVTAATQVNVPSRLPPRRVKQEQEPAAAPGASSSRGAALPEAVHSQLSELQAMVKQLCRRSEERRTADLPDGLFRLFTDLLDCDLSEQSARELIERVRSQVAFGRDDDVMLAKSRLARILSSEIATTGPIAIVPGKCRIAALVGPTGVGKTTTIAKLAANYRLKEKRRVGLITVDTYRIAAVEQLRTYAEIIELPMQVVSTPREMREAVRRMSGLDLVLLDTAGRSPKDEVKIQELRAFLTEAEADEVHLVLSAVAGTSCLQHTVERFSSVGAKAILLTKLDEAPSLGHLLPLLRGNLPLSYLTNGQNVPDDIEVADAKRLAGLLLKLEELR